MDVAASFDRFVESVSYLDEASKIAFKQQCLQILEYGVTPGAGSASRSVLVVGDVQSGKTLSFTGVTVLARERGYDFVVVIAGTKKNLLTQTYERLMSDLEGSESENWLLMRNPGPKQEVQLLQLVERNRALAPELRTVPVLVAMKNGARLNSVRHLVEALAAEFGETLTGLLIDDEADQAGLNVADVKPEEKSAVFSNLELLRGSLRHHTFLLYTATSQALTVVDYVDHMSPDNVVLLNTAPSYVGSADLFGADSKFAQIIPDTELQLATNAVINGLPVDSFLEALAYYYVCVALKDTLRLPDQTAMLIHPDMRKQVHGAYAGWIRRTNQIWIDWIYDALESKGPNNSVGAFFERALLNLEAIQEFNVPDYAVSFDSSFLQRLLSVIEKVQIREINTSARGVDVLPDEWVNNQAWVVVGGEKLGRGYTIENLLVTYMPRGRGMGMSDTVQQRGRFFGHKRSYLHAMRGWFSEDTINAFREIAEFEALFKDSIRDAIDSGLTLREWERDFVISANLRLTRDKAVSLGLARTLFRGGFIFSQKHLFDPLIANDSAEGVAIGLVAPYWENAKVYDRDERQNVQRHTVVKMSMDDAIALVRLWPMAREDRILADRLIVGLAEYGAKFSGRKALVVFMDNLNARRRKATPRGHVLSPRLLQIDNLFQGSNNSDGVHYPGDREMLEPDSVTIQIHRVAPHFAGFDSRRVLAMAIAWPLDYQRVHVTEYSPERVAE